MVEKKIFFTVKCEICCKKVKKVTSWEPYIMEYRYN